MTDDDIEDQRREVTYLRSHSKFTARMWCSGRAGAVVPSTEHLFHAGHFMHLFSNLCLNPDKEEERLRGVKDLASQ